MSLPKRRHWIYAVATLPALAIILGLFLSPIWAFWVMLFWPLYLAIRFDNHTGSLLILAVMLYVVIGILLAVVVLMGVRSTANL
ncbi:hypothetical protein ACFOWX_12180 [Sphingorhabdus arenilitoris]|uniref:Uncharacterized protein n=1 Tax=Sphingorhabdus arenilitoris TaxID=1490041 RepID=A0ABV8RIV6_9SPHN